MPNLARWPATTCRSWARNLHVASPTDRYRSSNSHDVQAWEARPAHSWPRGPISTVQPARRAGLWSGTCTSLGLGAAMGSLGLTTCRPAGRDLHVAGPVGRYRPSSPHDVQACRPGPAHSWPRRPQSPVRPARRAGLWSGTCTSLGLGAAMGSSGSTTCRSAGRDLHIAGPEGRYRPPDPHDVQAQWP